MSTSFFTGGIRDRTTKESREAANALASVKTMQRNPTWVPPKKIASLSTDDISKLKSKVDSSLLVSSTISTKQEFFKSQHNSKNHLLAEVEQEIKSRIRNLAASGELYEKDADFHNDVQLAADAEYLVRGIDPAAARSSERFAKSRRIQVTKKHWMAYKKGYYITQHGMAYVHTDGSVCMVPQNNTTKCPCGAVHIA
jgi:hypothetical protein